MKKLGNVVRLLAASTIVPRPKVYVLTRVQDNYVFTCETYCVHNNGFVAFWSSIMCSQFFCDS